MLAVQEKQTQVLPDSILQVAGGFMAAKHLFVASEMGLFEELHDGPATVEELAKRTGTNPRTIRILADAMVSLGFLDKRNGRYGNGPVADVYLSGKGAVDFRPFLRFWNYLSYSKWAKLEDAIRTGEAQITASENEEQQQIFLEGVEAVTSAAAQALARLYDFSNHHRILSLCGGSGSFLISVLSRYSHLTATLLEARYVLPIAERRLKASCVAERVALVEGDLFRSPIPGGPDAVILANVVHGLSPGRNMKLLQRLRGALTEGTRLLLVDFWTDPTHTQPTFAALLAGEFLMNTGEGDVYSVEDAHAWLTVTGWRLLEYKQLTGLTSLIVAEAAHY